jgi:hypothetical protein
VVNDGNLDSGSDTVQITVEDTIPPTITCSSPITIEGLNPSGVPTTHPQIQAFLASALANDNCDPSLMIIDNAPPYWFPLGDTTVTFWATDLSGNISSCDSTVTVEDTTPPTINSVSATPNVLQPPNRQMIPVVVSVDADDICDPAPFSRIVSVTSNEPVADGRRYGKTTPDWVITGNLTVLLRAEHYGTRPRGRVYTIYVECTDASGNTAPGSVEVEVPLKGRHP